VGHIIPSRKDAWITGSSGVLAGVITISSMMLQNQGRLC
jgi:hypothetical protein